MTTLTLRTPTHSPYAVLAVGSTTQPAPQRKRGLLTMSRLAEARTLSAPTGAVVLAVLQEAERITERTARIYRVLAERGVRVLLFPRGWTGIATPLAGLRLIGLAADDVARDEWDVLVCTPQRRFGFVSLDPHQPAPTEVDRVFASLTTHDEDSIAVAAEALLTRVPSLPVRIPALVG